MVLQRYNKYLKSYSISAIFFVFILHNDGRGKMEDGRRLRLLRIRRPNKKFSPIPIGLNNPVYLGCRDVR